MTEVRDNNQGSLGDAKHFMQHLQRAVDLLQGLAQDRIIKRASRNILQSVVQIGQNRRDTTPNGRKKGLAVALNPQHRTSVLIAKPRNQPPIAAAQVDDATAVRDLADQKIVDECGAVVVKGVGFGAHGREGPPAKRWACPKRCRTSGDFSGRDLFQQSEESASNLVAAFGIHTGLDRLTIEFLGIIERHSDSQ